MFASPFFTSGRSSILPTIATPEELHTANSVTQTTQWSTLVVGTRLAGTSVMKFGYQWAFVLNFLSFLFSACSIWRLRAPAGSFPVQRTALTEAEVVRPWHEYAEGLRYMRSTPLILGIAVISIGWRAAAERRRCSSASSANWSSKRARPALARSGPARAPDC
jgi:hypothetical protein